MAFHSHVAKEGRRAGSETGAPRRGMPFQKQTARLVSSDSLTRWRRKRGIEDDDENEDDYERGGDAPGLKGYYRLRRMVACNA